MMATGALSKMRRVRRSEVEWRELFARFDESAQTREAFYTEQNVVLSSFIRWWKKLRQSPRSQSAVVQNPVFVKLTSELGCRAAARRGSGAAADAPSMLSIGAERRI